MGIRDAFKVQPAGWGWWRDTDIGLGHQQLHDRSGRPSARADLNHCADEEAHHVVQESIRGNGERQAALTFVPPTDSEGADVIVVCRRRPLHGERTKTVCPEKLRSLCSKQFEVGQASQRPFAIVAERAVGIVVGAEQIAVLPLGGAESRVERLAHREGGDTAHVTRKHRVECPLQRFSLPATRDHDTGGLTERVHSGVGPTRTSHGHMSLHQPLEGLLQHTLHGPLRGLSLPAGKRLAVILNDQLEGVLRHCGKPRPGPKRHQARQVVVAQRIDKLRRARHPWGGGVPSDSRSS